MVELGKLTSGRLAINVARVLDVAQVMQALRIASGRKGSATSRIADELLSHECDRMRISELFNYLELIDGE